MQTVCLPQAKTSIDNQLCKPDNGEMLYFSLEGTLPAGHTLVLNIRLGTLSYLSRGIDRPRLEMQQQFTSSELSLLRPLLELSVEHVLATHGGPNDPAALKRALSSS